MKNVKKNHFPKKLMAAALVFVLFTAVILPAASPAGAVEDPEITTAAAYLWDLDAQQVLYSKNASERRAPASLTKIMTALLAVESYENGQVALSDVVTVEGDPYFDIAADGSSANIKEGEQFTFEQLLYSSLMASTNESCNVLAQYLAGDVASFVEMMNTRARELGCTGTHFVNTHGMPDDDHYTTAEDMAKIAAEASRHNLFKRVVSTVSYTIPATNMSDQRELRTTNSLLRSDSQLYYEYATGMKTGSTSAAGYCLVATAAKDGRQLLSVVLGGESVIAANGQTVTTNFTETKRLLEWGFNNWSYQEVLSTMNILAEMPVELGRGISSVTLRPERNVTVLLPNDVTLPGSTVTGEGDDEGPQIAKLDIRVFNNGPLTAPVEQGQILGEVSVSVLEYVDGQPTGNYVDYGTVSLVANTKVELDRAAYIMTEIRSTLENRYVRLGLTLFVVMLILYAAFIVYYNIRRFNKRRVAQELARRRVEEYQRSQETSTGKSFEEIEARHREFQETRRR